MSSTHFALETDDAGCYVRDLGSTNGTLVNGRRIMDRVLLRQGDEIVAGETRFALRDRGRFPGRSGLRCRPGCPRVRRGAAIRPAPRVAAARGGDLFGGEVRLGADPLPRQQRRDPAGQPGRPPLPIVPGLLDRRFPQPGFSAAGGVGLAELPFRLAGAAGGGRGLAAVGRTGRPLDLAHAHRARLGKRRRDLPVFPAGEVGPFGPLAALPPRQAEARGHGRWNVGLLLAQRDVDAPGPQAPAFVRQLLVGIDAVLVELPDLPETWQVYGEARVADLLAQVGFSRKPAEHSDAQASQSSEGRLPDPGTTHKENEPMPPAAYVSGDMHVCPMVTVLVAWRPHGGAPPC